MGKGANKLGKYRFMKKSTQLAAHLPETKWMTQNSFWHLIRKYGRVIVKPNNGSGGARVILVTSKGNGNYRLHMGRRRIRVKQNQRLLTILKRVMRNRRYIVQRGINLIKVNNCPMDIRVIVQRRKNSSQWHVTGTVAKVAGKGFIVTNNTRSKGTLMRVSDAVSKSSIRNRSPESLVLDLHRVALLSAYRLAKLYPHHRIYGLDLGLDRNGHVWIIEANRAPSMSHFLKLNDRTTYDTIMNFKKGHTWNSPFSRWSGVMARHIWRPK